MPFHLPPISRRQFLKRTLVAGSSALLADRLFAEPAPVDPHAWALLSDPHIDANPDFVARGANMTSNLTRVVGEVAALPQRPSSVLVNGDCAYVKGEPGDYASFTGLLEPMRTAQMPIHLTLGNHDDREHFHAAIVAATDEPVANKHVSVVSSERANWILLDSLNETNHTPGLLGDEQRAWLAKTLDAHTDKPAIVVGHHSLAPAPTKVALLDTAELLAILTPRRHVKAFVFGHTHDWKTTTDESGLHFINLPPVAYVFNPGRPNGWVHAHLASDSITLRLNCLDQAHPQHGETKTLAWRS